jgi:hypothetical protein
MISFCDVMSCSVGDMYQCFGVICCFHLQERRDRRKNIFPTQDYCIRFCILRTVTMKITVFWNMTPCLVDRYRSFGGNFREKIFFKFFSLFLLILAGTPSLVSVTLHAHPYHFSTLNLLIYAKEGGSRFSETSVAIY